MRDGNGKDVGTGDPEHFCDPVSALQLAIAAEADLRHLDGLVSVLGLLGERTDPIEPKVLAALAQATEPPLSRLISLHRAATKAQPKFAPRRTEVESLAMPEPVPVPATITAPPVPSPTAASPISASTTFNSNVLKGES